MADELPSYEDLTKYVRDLPKEIIGKLPDGIASRRAKQLIDTVYDYAKEAREQAPRPTAAEMHVSAQREGVAWLVMAQDDEQHR